jgi:hypothetical protein
VADAIQDLAYFYDGHTDMVHSRYRNDSTGTMIDSIDYFTRVSERMNGLSIFMKSFAFSSLEVAGLSLSKLRE